MDVAENCFGIPSAIHSAGRNSNPSLPTTVQGLRGNDSHGLSDPYVNVFLAPSSKNVSMSMRPVLHEPTGICELEVLIRKVTFWVETKAAASVIVI